MLCPVLIEIENRHLISVKLNEYRTVKDVIKKVEKMGYKSYYNVDNRLLNTGSIKIDDVQSNKLINTKKYINNFFFLPIDI